MKEFKIRVRLCLLMIGFAINIHVQGQPHLDSLFLNVQHGTGDLAHLKSAYSLASYLVEAGQDSAVQYLQLAERLNQSVGDIEYRFALLILRSAYHIRKHEFDSTRLLCETMMLLSQQYNLPEWKVAPLNDLGILMLHAGQPDSADLYFCEAEKILESTEYVTTDGPKERIFSELFAALLYHRSLVAGKTDYVAAVSFLERSTFHYQKLEDLEGQLITLQQLGRYLARLKAYKPAMEAYEKAYYLAEMQQSRLYQFRILLSMLSVARRVGDYEYALALKEELQPLLGGMHSKDLFSYYVQLARLALAQEKPQEALVSLNRALEKLPAGMTAQKSIVYLILGKVYAAMEDYQKAKNYLESVLVYLLDEPSLTQQMELYKAIIPVYAALGEEQEGLHAALALLELQSQSGGSALEDQISQFYAQLWTQKNEAALTKAKGDVAEQALKLSQANLMQETLKSQRNLILLGAVMIILLGVLTYFFVLRIRKQKTLTRVRELELKALRAQVNPHFLFNALSSIQLMINQGAVREANISLSRFACLVRRILENSEKQFVPLQEELEMLEQYMALEALRFKFGFRIIVAPTLDVNEVKIPTMVVQPLVENAIKHGLAAKKDCGKVTISLRHQDNQLLCIIQDNGIGREASRALSKGKTNHQSMGTLLTEERLQLLARGQRLKPMQFTDLVDEHGVAQGTRVEILLPIPPTNI